MQNKLGVSEAKGGGSHPWRWVGCRGVAGVMLSRLKNPDKFGVPPIMVVMEYIELSTEIGLWFDFPLGVAMDNVGLVKEEFQRGKSEEDKLRLDRLEVYFVALLEHVALLDRIVNPDGMVVPTKK